MAVETAADRAAFVNPDDFGVAATYTPVAGGAVTVNGIYDNPFAAAGEFEQVGFASTEPRFTCRSADLPNGAGNGDQIVISGTAYTVRVIEPDETGDMSILVLVKD